MLDERTCIFCLAPHSMSVRFDKKSKPYLRCAACSTRAFLGARGAMNGVAVLLPYAEEIVARMQTDGAYAATKLAEIDRFHEAVLAGLRVPANMQPAIASAAAIAGAERSA